MAGRAPHVLAGCALMLLLPTACRTLAPTFLTLNETAHCKNNPGISESWLESSYKDQQTRIYLELREYEITCKLSETETDQFRTQIIIEYRFNLFCSLNDKYFDVKKIPRVNLRGKTHLNDYFFMNDCPLPPDTYADTIKYLGFTSTPKLLIKQIGHNAALQRKHLEGLDKLNVTELKLFNSGKLNLTDDIFQDMKQLQVLTLSNNRLHIARDIFSHLIHLKILHMSGCGLSALPEGLFALPALKQLYLDNNNLVLQNSTFEQLKSLQLLSLFGNSLKTLPPNVFAALSNLKQINLSENHFTFLPLRLFQHCSKLESFKLSYSRNLSTVPYDLLNNMKKLTKVDLSRNGISGLPEGVFENSMNISTLYLEDNKLSNLNESNFSALVNLRYLSLSHNGILKVPDNAFSNLKLLEILKLDHNEIITLESGALSGLQKLKELHLNSNKLSDKSFWGDWSLSNPTSLQILELAYNSMTSIPTEIQHMTLNGLVSLNLSHNKITKIESIARDLYFKKIKDIQVDLSSNRIKEFYLPDDDDSYDNIHFSNMVNITIQDNPISCDCTLFPLIYYLWTEKKLNNLIIDPGKTKCAAPMDLVAVQISKVTFNKLSCVHDHTFDRCSLIEIPYNSSKVIDCSNGQLHQDDTFLNLIEKIHPMREFYNPNRLQHTKLILDNNKITYLRNYREIPKEVTVLSLRNTSLQLNSADIPSHIEELDLRDNSLKFQDDAVTRDILFGSENRTVQLSGNMFACDCNNIDFLIKLHKQKAKVLDFEDLECSIDTAGVESKVAFIQFNEICDNTRTYMIAVIIAAVVILIFAILYAEYKYALKAWLVNNFEWPRKFLLKKVPVDIRNLKKDVFVSYSHVDEEDMDKILTFIQKKGYTTINHRDDWLGGCSILESIEDSIRDSQTTIFLVTPHFVESGWSTHEFRVAFMEQVQERGKNIIVIMKGDVDAIVKKDKILKAYVKRFTYLTWEDPNLEDRLTLCLPERLADRMAKIELNEHEVNDKKIDGLDVIIHENS